MNLSHNRRQAAHAIIVPLLLEGNTATAREYAYTYARDDWEELLEEAKLIAGYEEV